MCVFGNGLLCVMVIFFCVLWLKFVECYGNCCVMITVVCYGNLCVMVTVVL